MSPAITEVPPTMKSFLSRYIAPALAALTLATGTPLAAATLPDILPETVVDVTLSATEMRPDWSAYLGGSVRGYFTGQSSAGGWDAFVQKLDPTGLVLWTSQFGSSGADDVLALKATPTSLYVAGSTWGTLPGQTSAGELDAYVSKYSVAGQLQWSRQFGTPGNDQAWAVTSDTAGNVYVGGWTSGLFSGQQSAGSFDAFVRKYDPSGTLLWQRQFGTLGDDRAEALAPDSSGGLYVAGTVSGALPGQTASGTVDAFVRRYDANGTELWTRQFGTSESSDANVLTVDAADNVYVGGNVSGAFAGQVSSGNLDVFVRKYSPAGALAWTSQFGSGDGSQLHSMGLDAASNLYLSGLTWGTLPGQASQGGMDSFVRQYNPAGPANWTRQFGTSADEEPTGMALNGSGSLGVMGFTYDSSQTLAMDTWTATMASAGSLPSLQLGVKLTPNSKRGQNVLKVHHIKKKNAGYTPAQVQSLLQLQGNGAGQTIAIVAAMDSPSVLADLNAFSKAFNLPLVCGSAALHPGDPCFNFTKATPQGQPAAQSTWSLSTSAAVQWAHAVAPMANILLVEAISNQLDSLMGVIDYAAGQGATVISGSWGVPEFGDQLLYDQRCALTTAVCVFPAGNVGTGGFFPAASPFVVAVGGTELTLNNSGAVTSEIAWDGSGGGLSQFEVKPAYQAAKNPGLMRGIPDVSYNADPDKGFTVYSSTPYLGQKGWFEIGGTDMGAPQWAAILAVANQLRGVRGPLTSATFQVQTALYTLTTGLFDVTTGSNGACGPLCTAAPGYDYVTGLGSPRPGIDLALALAP